MSSNDLAIALRAFTKRRPFRPFIIELKSGTQFVVTHPEAIDRKENFFVFWGPKFSHAVFTGESVCQLIAPPPE